MKSEKNRQHLTREEGKKLLSRKPKYQSVSHAYRGQKEETCRFESKGPIMYWYVWRCKTDRELVAKHELAELGMQVVCPTIKEYRRYKHKDKREIERALFRGYVIAGADDIDWIALADLARHPQRALLGVVCLGDGPARISQPVVDHIAARSWTDVDDMFCPGDDVRVTHWPRSSVTSPRSKR